MAFKASPSSQHQHCTDEAHKAETVLSAVGYIYIYIYIYISCAEILEVGKNFFAASSVEKMSRFEEVSPEEIKRICYL